MQIKWLFYDHFIWFDEDKQKISIENDSFWMRIVYEIPYSAG